MSSPSPSPSSSTEEKWTIAELPFIFSDVTPIAQEHSPMHVCQIDYPSDFILAYDYMRAMLARDERSERALKLTATCLSLNPANYTVWHFRRLCLLQQCDNFLTEDVVYADLELASMLGGANPKNYQIAFHRRTLLEKLGLTPLRAQRELAYIGTVLKQEDGKNYHMWSSRQWILKTIHDMARNSTSNSTSSSTYTINDNQKQNHNHDESELTITIEDSDRLWEAEIQFTNELIVMDCFNNSAWNHRWFVIHRGDTTPPTTKNDNDNDDTDSLSFSFGVAKQEANYVMSVIQLDPYNESPWRYLIGIIREHVSLVYDYEPMLAAASADNYCGGSLLRDVFVDADRSVQACIHYQSAHVDLLELKNTKQDIQHAMTICQSLANEYDTIRQKYWNLRWKELDQKKIQISMTATLTSTTPITAPSP